MPERPEETVANPTLPSFFYADPSGEGLSYEQLKQRRAIAAALASRTRPYPTTIGQGLAALGEGIGDRLYQERTEGYERQQRDLDRRAREDAGGLIPPPPAAPRRTSDLAVPSEVQKTAAALDETPDPVSTMVADDRPVPRADVARTVLARQGVIPPGGAPAALPGLPPSQPLAGPAPMSTRYAALNTGSTMSDAGQPGATYGGPPPAGPGASTAEPPVENPPAPSALPTAPPGPVGTPAPGVAGGGPGSGPGRATLAGSLLAQAGVTPPVPARAPTRVPTVTPPAPIRAAPGTLTQPPEAGPSAPQTYPAPGQTRMNAPEPEGPRPPKPLIGQDTPDMARIKRTLANPAYRDMSPMQREQLTQTYQRLKESRDKQDSENLTEWNRLDADWLTRRKERQEKERTLPKERLELSEKENEETIRRRFNTVENYKQTVANTKEGADKAKAQADALHNLYKAEQILKNDPMVAGLHAQTGPGIPVPGVGHVGFPSNTYWRQVMGETGFFPESKTMAENTQQYRALLRPMMKSMLQQTTGAGAISNVEVDQALEAIGLGANAEKGAMLGILNNLRETAIRKIHEHNKLLGETWNVPAQDENIHKQFRVDIPTDPIDAASLHVSNTPEDRAAFDRKYGPGAAARELGRR